MKFSLVAEQMHMLFGPLQLKKIATMLMVAFLSRKHWSYAIDGTCGCPEFLTLTDKNRT